MFIHDHSPEAIAIHVVDEEGFEAARSAFFSHLVRRVLKSPEQILAGMRRPEPPPANPSPSGGGDISG